MIRKFAWLLLVSLLICIPSVAEEVKRVTAQEFVMLEIRGKKEDAVIWRDETTPLTATAGMRLVEGDGLTTGPTTTAFLLANRNRLFQLDPYGLAIVEKLTDKELTLTVEEGKLFFNVRKPLKEDETLEINAGGTTMSIRGTRGALLFVPPDRIDVAVQEGHVVITAGGNEYPVGAGTVLNLTRTADGLGFTATETPLNSNDRGFSTFIDWSTNDVCDCDEGGHQRLQCNHFICDPDGPHGTTCAQCGRFLCDGRVHELCPYCAKYQCVGYHAAGVCNANPPSPTPTATQTQRPSNPTVIATPTPTPIPTPVPTAVPTPAFPYACPACGNGIMTPDSHTCPICLQPACLDPENHPGFTMRP